MSEEKINKQIQKKLTEYTLLFRLFLWRFLLRLCFPPPIIYDYFTSQQQTEWKLFKIWKVCMYTYYIQEVHRQRVSSSDFSRETAWQCYSNIRIVWMNAKYSKIRQSCVLSVFILHPKSLGFHGVKTMSLDLNISDLRSRSFILEFSCENEMNTRYTPKLVHKKWVLNFKQLAITL